MLYRKKFSKEALSALRDVQLAAQRTSNPPTIAQNWSHHHTLLLDPLHHRVPIPMMQAFRVVLRFAYNKDCSSCSSSGE